MQYVVKKKTFVSFAFQRIRDLILQFSNKLHIALYGKTCFLSKEDEDQDLRFLLQRTDPEAVSHSPDVNPSWFSDPKHKTKSLGNYPTYQELGVTKRSVSPVNRSVGRFGSEIATKV